MQFMDDVRYAMRQFAHAPGFTATAVLTLALGIGATTAIFTLVHAVLLKSLPVAKPSELIRIGDNENCCVNGGLQDNWSLFSYDKYKTFRDGTHGFTELAAFQAGRGLMGVRRNASNQPAESMRTQYVSGNYFSMFGVSAYAGRMFTPGRRSPGSGAGRGDELRDLAAEIRVGSVGDWGELHLQRVSFYRDWCCAAEILRRSDGKLACLLVSTECRDDD